MEIFTLVFSPFEVNTYVISDPSGECVIIDPACNNKEEQTYFYRFINEKNLKPRHLLQTHCHLDHVFGSAFVCSTFLLEPEAHSDEEFNNQNAVNAAKIYGIKMQTPHPINKYLDEKNTIKFGNSELKILHIPGHTAGSLLFYNETEKLIIAGDVLFNGSIGRTDLPGGNYELLISGINDKLMQLPEDTVVYPGHGETTTIGKEKKTNPYLIRRYV